MSNNMTIDLDIDKLKVNAPCPHCHKNKIVHLIYEQPSPILQELEKRKIIKLADMPLSFQESPKYYCYGCRKMVFDDYNICPICWHKIDDKVTRTCIHCGWKRDISQEKNPENTWGCNVIPHAHYQDNWILILSLVLGDSICIYPLDITNSYFEGIFIRCLTAKNSPIKAPVIVLKTSNDTYEYIPINRIQAINKIEPLPIVLKEESFIETEEVKTHKILKPIFESQNKNIL